MSHFTVLVIGENAEDQLAPFQENNMGDCPEQYLEFHEDEDGEIDSKTGKKGWWENPNRKWDWYSLGGRWTGFFKVREGAISAVGSPGLMTRPAEAGHGDSLLKEDIDFDYMRNEAGNEAQNTYEAAMKIIEGAPTHESWDSIRERFKDIKEARDFYHDQPRLKEWRKHSDKFGIFSSPDDFMISKEDYIENARNAASVTHAVIKDGKWYESGKMGWWGVVLDAKDANEWNKEFSALMDSLPGNTLLSVYDCHI